MSIEEITFEAEERMEKSVDAAGGPAPRRPHRAGPTSGWSSRSASTTTALPRRSSRWPT